MNPMRSLVKKVGAPPGTLVYTGEKEGARARITIADWDASGLRVIEDADPADCARFRDSDNVTWINVEGLQDIDTLSRLGEDFSIHPLILEDILDTDQRAKVEDHGDLLYIVMRHLSLKGGTEVSGEQVSIVLSRKVLITFLDGPSAVFAPVRERLEDPGSRLRTGGTEYLAYSLMDTIVDNHLLVLELLEERIEGIEEDLTGDARRDVLDEINLLRKQMILVRRVIAPLREVMATLYNGTSSLMGEEVRIYLQDLRDHWTQSMELVDSDRELLSHLLDVHLSLASNRMNEVMKVLTVIATIFIPLTFIAGIYGMNFQGMPELESPMGYPLAILSMAALAGTMVLYFRRKGWL